VVFGVFGLIDDAVVFALLLIAVAGFYRELVVHGARRRR